MPAGDLQGPVEDDVSPPPAPRRPRRRVVTRERLTGVGVALLGLLVFAVLIPWGIDRPGNVGHTALAPDFWPRIVAAMMVALGLVQAIGPVPDDDDEDGGGSSGRWLHRLPGLAAALGALFGFYVLIPPLGMVAPGAVLIFGLMVFGGERRWRLAAAVAAAVPLLLYVFFAHVAGIPIPLGVFETLRG